jgi:hypothetical protein
MPQIVLDDGQARVVTEAVEPVEVRDRKGHLLGFIPAPWTEEEIAEAERVLHSSEPGYTYAEIRQYLESLPRS